LNNFAGYAIIIGLPFLTKRPSQYTCVYEDQAEPVSCEASDLCENPRLLSFEPKRDAPDFYENWIGQYDLACASHTKIGLIATTGYIGYTLTCLCLPRISDRIGRHKLIVT